MNAPQEKLDLNAVIASAINQQITNPALLGSLTALTMRQIGNALTSASWQGSIDASIFLTPIKKLKTVSLALVLPWVVAPFAWRVLAQKKQDGSYALYVFQVNEGDTTKSVVSDLTEGEEANEQRAELIRQLDALGHEGTKMYTALAIDREIEGYKYWTDPQQEQSSDSPSEN